MVKIDKGALVGVIILAASAGFVLGMLATLMEKYL